MANDAAVIGLTYDSTDLQEDPFGIFLQIVRGLSETPEVRGEDSIVPALPFRVARNRVEDRLVIELRGYVAGTGSGEANQRSSFRTLMTSVRALFAPDRTPADLVATLENGDVRYVSARPLNLFAPTIVPSCAEVSIELEALTDWDELPGS